MLYEGAFRVVVPHVGTWIEIESPTHVWPVGWVVPHVGTWIEISQ